ncbi:MAG: ADYC domain-containing protein, partial [Microvirga sp.]
MAGPTRHPGCFALLLAAMPAVASAQPALRVDGTEFVLTAGDGRVMRSHDLVGATLQLEIAGRASEILIRDVRDDRESVGRVVLHHFLIRAADGPRTEVCAPDAKGESLGFPVPDGRGGFEITCTGGAVAKCIRFGYRPWDEVPGGPPLKALHAACIR